MTKCYIVTMGYSLDASFVDRARFRLRPPTSSHAFELVDVAGARLRVRDVGSGTLAFVMAPDPPNVLEHHDALLGRFAAHGRALGIELPGFGHSSVPPDFGFTVAENADLVIEALAVMGVGRAVLMFPCVAGLIALEAARRAPERVAAVVLSQTPGFDDALAWSRRVDFGGLIGTPVIGQILVRAFRERLADEWYQNALPRGVDRAPYLTRALAAYDHGADYCLASALQALRRDARPSAPVPVPVLSVWGDGDRTHRKSDPRGGIALAPRSRLVTLTGAGHFPDLERPDRFASEVLRFVSEVAA